MKDVFIKRTFDIGITGIFVDENGEQYIVTEFMSKGSVKAVLEEEGESMTIRDRLSM